MPSYETASWTRIRRPCHIRDCNFVNTPSHVIWLTAHGLNVLYEALTPGVHDPLHDKPLGCSFEDFYGNYQDGPDQTWTGGGRDFIGIHGGMKDHDGCSNSPETIGDPIDTVNGVVVSVTDINVVISNSTLVGWMYKGTNGTRYYQPNYATQAALNFNVGIGVVSGGVTSPGGYGQVKPWTGGLPPGSRPYKCFTNGGNLVG